MAEMDLGSALTGEDPNSAAAKWDDFMQRPGNRQALLQIGLQLMQPVGIGQTAGGHIAQAIGAGGEAVDRGSNLDLKEYMADSKLADADARLGIAQQVADATTLRANTAAAAAGERKSSGGLTETFRERARRQDEWRETQRVDRDAARIQSRLDKLRSDKLLNPNLATPPDLAPFEGKDIDQIRSDLKKKRGAVAAPAESVDDGGDDGDTPVAMPATPPVAGAKLAPDGQWYLPDPKRPGKFLKVN